MQGAIASRFQASARTAAGLTRYDCVGWYSSDRFDRSIRPWSEVPMGLNKRAEQPRDSELSTLSELVLLDHP